MLPLETLVGERGTSPVVDELIRRLCNPADAMVDQEQLTRYIVGVYGVGFMAVEGAQTEADLITPDEFQSLVVPSLIRAGFDSGIVRIDTNGTGIQTVNKEKHPRRCLIQELPGGTIDQINASHVMADRLSNQIIANVELNSRGQKLKASEKWVHASYEMAKMAYGNRKRKSGRPFITHPEDIASIVNAGLDAIRKQGHSVSEKTRAFLICAALLHDALEEWAKPADYYIAAAENSRPTSDVLTPLVIKTTMEKLGMQEGAASYLANAIRLVTHEKGKKGEDWMLTFAQYLYRGSGNRLVAPIKPTDMFHNLTVEEKPLPTQKEDESDEAYIERVLYWDRHRGEYYYYLYEDGYRQIDYEKNAYRHDVSLRKWGDSYFEWLISQAYPDNPPNRAVVDVNRGRGKAMMKGTEYAAQVIPLHRGRLTEKFHLQLSA